MSTPNQIYDRLNVVSCRLFDDKKPVQVYLNSRRGLWSVRQKGKVVGYAKRLYFGDVRFHVNKLGRNRVLRTGRKNVHAYVVGRLLSQEECEKIFIDTIYNYPLNGFVECSEVGYNPYKAPSFMDLRLDCPIHHAIICDMDINRVKKIRVLYLRD